MEIVNEEIVNATSISSLKNRLDKFWQNQDIIYNYKAVIDAGSGTWIHFMKIVVFN